ncbi:MAG: DUF4136 domain-containing protein, partial [Cytophagales bacterium]|nr:DUF4136 domain-containing protein [Cytophagales bacterium]
MKSTLLMLAAAAFLLNACYPGGPDTVDDYDVVSTRYEPGFNFAAVRTYLLVDSVAQVGDGSHSGQSTALSPKLNAFILQQVATRLDNLGYTRLTGPAAGQQPDVVVQVSAVTTQNVGASYNDSWWDYWGWYPGWSYYYPYIGGGWYPYGAVSYYSYRTGTVSIEMFNPGGANAAAKQIPRVWIAALDGIL